MKWGILGKEHSGSRNRQFKGPEVGSRLICSSDLNKSLKEGCVVGREGVNARK